MIDILFENDDLLAVNKPEGIASIPERLPGRESLVRHLEAAVSGKMYVVHRLDKEVSGVILFAKNATVHRLLSMQFSGHEVKKLYTGLALGRVEEEHGVIDKPLREFGSGRIGVDAGRGKRSATEFEVEDRFGEYSLLNISPLTGRRHQIRVHFYSIGHPIAGDLRYGDAGIQGRFPRLMLHARHIRFRLPSGGPMSVEAPLPESFQRVLETLRQSGGKLPPLP